MKLLNRRRDLAKNDSSTQPDARKNATDYQPHISDTDATVPVLVLCDKEKDFGYDPYDSGSFWVSK